MRYGISSFFSLINVCGTGLFSFLFPSTKHLHLWETKVICGCDGSALAAPRLPDIGREMDRITDPYITTGHTSDIEHGFPFNTKKG